MNGSSAPLVVAIRGPILLITLGFLFVVDHFGEYGFGQTWPALIIIYGVLRLLEKCFEPPIQRSVPPGGNLS